MRKRTKTSYTDKSLRPTAILTADIELRLDPPVSRTDDYREALVFKIRCLKKLQLKYRCPVLDAGDLFDKKYKQNPSNSLLRTSMGILPRDMYSIPGNHDLPGKTIKNYNNSAMSVLEAAGILRSMKYFSTREEGTPDWLSPDGYGIFIHPFPWGVPIKNIQKPAQYKNEIHVAIIHTMVYDGNPPFPGCEGWEKRKLMKKLKGFDLILTGHHHQTFTGRNRNTLLVNPGSMMRNDADQVDHRPCVFLWYAESQGLKTVYLPIENDVISREHLDERQGNERRLDAFVEKLGDQSIEGIDFEVNLENMVQKAPQGVSDKVWKYYEGGTK